MKKETITVSVDYKIEYRNSEGREKAIKIILGTLSHGFVGGSYNAERMSATAKLNTDDRYEQIKVAVQDLLIDLRYAPEDIRGFANGSMGQSHQPLAKTCQKLIDAGVLENVRITGETRWRDNT